MFRALIELLITIAVVLIARAVFTSILRGVARASSRSFQGDPLAGHSRPDSSRPAAGEELHKDPVCGTYVAASAAFRRAIGGRTFYYCSENCREKHALAAK